MKKRNYLVGLFALLFIVSIQKIEAQESGDYTYHADLVYGKNGKGELTLINKEGRHFGSMRLGNRFFRIESLEGIGEDQMARTFRP